MKLSTHTLTTVINLDGKDLKLEVSFSYYPGCRGIRGPFGEPETPDDEPEIELLLVEEYIEGVGPQDIMNLLPDDILRQLEKECWDMAEGH